MSIFGLYKESSTHAYEFYQYQYWQFCYKIVRSAGNKKSLIIRLCSIVTLTYHFLNMVLIYQILNTVLIYQIFVIVSLVLKKISNRNVYYKVKCIFGQVYL